MASVKWLVVVCVIFCAGMLYADTDVTTGMVNEGYQVQQPATVVLPENFDVSAATAALKEARRAGDQERVRELAAQLSTWWIANNEHAYYPDDHGYNTEPPKWNKESHASQGGSPDWGDDVRIAPQDGVRDVKIASISNGDLYSYALWIDGTEDHILMHRSTDNGQTWNVYWDNNFYTTDISSLGILNDNDTLITWYVLQSSNTYRTWVRVVLPGASDTPIYWGSPTGGFNPIIYYNLHVTTDAPIYTTGEYVYASWCEQYGTGPDSTRVMSAVSWNNDVSAWEVGPTTLGSSSGANIYYTGTETAFGSTSDMMWIVCWLHPYGYPTTYDRTVKGWYSTNYGSTWSTRIDITPNNNGVDEYESAVAASHSNTNWVVLARQDTITPPSANSDVNCWYSTDDGTAWNFLTWITNYDNYLPDVWVDDNSNAFFAACRSNTPPNEYIRYKVGTISNPATWATSEIVNDDATNLSDVYGPSVSYNMGNDDAILAWTNYNSSIYSIWFDSEDWVTGVAELPANAASRLNLRLAPNPAIGFAQLTYSISTEGMVNIAVYDAAGRLVNNPVHETRPAGEYSVNMDNTELAAGIYFIKVETPDGVGTKTMTIVR